MSALRPNELIVQSLARGGEPTRRTPVAVVSVSGGKDSTATALCAINTYGRDRVRLVFADTGNEHEITLEYVHSYLPRALGLPIETVKADFSEQIAAKRMFIARDQRTSRDDRGRRRRWSNKAKRRALEILQPTGNSYLDLCLWKGRFPSRRAQFCTQHLKRIPLDTYIDHLFDAGERPESWRGIRRAESAKRAHAKARFIEGTSGGRAFWVVQPIVDWSAAEVFDYCASHGVEPNPLYRQGMGRVGCMPCINCGKDELREIALRFPDHVARIREWEKVVAQSSKRAMATFFPDPDESSRMIDRARGILSQIEWAMTARGGRQLDWLRSLEEPAACSSLYGLCE